MRNFSLFIFSILAIFTGINADQLEILHTPPSIQFFGEQLIDEKTLLKDILTTALGLSTDMTYAWKGMKIINPFETPECAVIIFVEGVASVGSLGDTVKVYPMTSGAHETDIFKKMKRRLARLNQPKCELSNVHFSSVNVSKFQSPFGTDSKAKPQSQVFSNAKANSDHDRFDNFQRTLEVMKTLTAALKNGVRSDGIQDFFIFTFDDFCDWPRDTNITEKAKKLLNLQIRELKESLKSSYGGNVLVTAVMKENCLVAQRRSQELLRMLMQNALKLNLTELNPTTTEKIVNIKKKIPLEVLHICFLVGCGGYFIVLAVLYTMVTMDPGMNSAVYRSTSTIDRVKLE